MALVECLGHPDILSVIQAKIVEPAVRSAVAETSKIKDEEISALKTELSCLKAKLNECNQFNRRNNVCIYGVPESDGEILKNEVKKLATKIKVSIGNREIDDAFRMGKKCENITRPILVQFSSLTIRNEFLRARRELQAAGLKTIFINEHLTKENSELMYHLRKLKKQKKIFAAWTEYGKPRVRFVEGGATLKISCIDDVMEFCSNNSSTNSANPSSLETSVGHKSTTRKSLRRNN